MKKQMPKILKTNDFILKKCDIINIRVHTKSSKSIILFDVKNNLINVYVHSIASDNRANLDVSGLKSRNKKIKIL